MNKQVILIIFSILAAYVMHAQPTLSITSDALEVKAVDHTTIASPEAGMMVYDMNQNAFMYYDGTEWQTLGSKALLVDEDSDTKVELIEGPGSMDEIHITIDDEKVAIFSSNDNDDFTVSPFGTINTFYGSSAGLLNTSTSNSFFGRLAGLFNTEGSRNTFIGNASGYLNTTGQNNVVIGHEAAYGNQQGSNNVIIGNNAGSNGTSAHDKSGNVFIGYSAGRTETGSNKLIVENTFDGINPLLYGDFATNYLRVGGELNINNQYSLPYIDGASNQVIQTDGNGILTWGNLPISYWFPVPGGLT